MTYQRWSIEAAMDAHHLETEIERAEAELGRIAHAIAEMERRRALLQDYVESSRKLRDDLARDEAQAAGRRVNDAVPPPVPRGAEFASDADASAARSRRRAYMAEVVQEAIEILNAHPEGRPLSAGEIHPLHSRRDEFTPKELYIAMYKRVTQGRHLRAVNGRFWPLERPLPAGWSEKGPVEADRDRG